VGSITTAVAYKYDGDGRRVRVEVTGGASIVKQRFTGQMRDGETNLDYFNVRYLSPNQGRFTSPDLPLIDQTEGSPQSWNLYGYARNNPLRLSDPTGRSCVYNDGDTNKKNPVGDNGDGYGCAQIGVYYRNETASQKVNVGISSNERGLLTLQLVGQNLSSPHQWGTVVSGGAQDVGSVLAPLPTAFAQCATGACSSTGIAMAVLPGASMQRFVKNRKLLNILKNWNRTGSGGGTGSTADAIRTKILTGIPVDGKFHFQKGEETRRGLFKLLRDPSLDASDRKIVEELLVDLQNALSTPRR